MSRKATFFDFRTCEVEAEKMTTNFICSHEVLGTPASGGSPLSVRAYVHAINEGFQAFVLVTGDLQRLAKIVQRSDRIKVFKRCPGYWVIHLVNETQ